MFDEHKYDDFIRLALARCGREVGLLGLTLNLIRAVIWKESSFNSKAVSPCGAQGLMQLMPATAAELGCDDPFDPEQNIRAGTLYLFRLLRAFGQKDLALAAYNAGPGNVREYKGIPPFKETMNYVAKILEKEEKYNNEATTNY